MAAFCAFMVRSAAAMSGRRSSRVDGTPTGTVRQRRHASCCAECRAPRAFLPTSTAMAWAYCARATPQPIRLAWADSSATCAVITAEGGVAVMPAVPCALVISQAPRDRHPRFFAPGRCWHPPGAARSRASRAASVRTASRWRASPRRPAPMAVFSSTRRRTWPQMSRVQLAVPSSVAEVTGRSRPLR